jgi:hypothetical protein
MFILVLHEATRRSEQERCQYNHQTLMINRFPKTWLIAPRAMHGLGFAFQRRMLRNLTVTLFILVSIGGAAAQGRAPFDIQAHCMNAGGPERVARCKVNERFSRMWGRYTKIEPTILYQCARLIISVRGGFLDLRSCILSRSDASI